MAAKQIKTKICLCIFLLICACQTFAQSSRAHSSKWLLPTISYKCSNRFKVVLQANFIPQEHSTYAYAQAFVKMGKHLTLNSGYMYISLPDQDGRSKDQSTFLTGTILAYPVTKKITFENRSLVWNRFINNSEDQHLVLNRLRFIRTSSIGGRQFQFYVFDEASFDLSHNEWSRNRAGLGSSLVCSNHITMDFAFARQYDSNGSQLNIAFVTLTLDVSHYRSDQ
jgi:hypothetical protein